MYSWPHPHIPSVDGTPVIPRLYDTSSGRCLPVEQSEGPTGMYVCGITPYDATHLGHAATYVTFDLIHRLLLDNGRQVTYVQNVTDIDEPLFERANDIGVDWRALGDDQINLYRSDMDTLGVIPPTHLVGVTEAIDDVIELVSVLLAKGHAYDLDGDIYADAYATEHFGYLSHRDRATMYQQLGDNGGDPDRQGKHNPLDPLLWRARREGEPWWEAPFGAGRPGWHVECAAIARTHLGDHFAIQGGGADLVYPHHEYSAAHVEAASSHQHPRMAGIYVHTGMIGLDGTKMSKSLGNLVFVHRLTQAGHHPSAIRLGIYTHHYRSNRDWSEELLTQAENRRELWCSALDRAGDLSAARQMIQALRTALADDLDTPTALRIIDRWASEDAVIPNEHSAQLVETALDALLGVRLR